MANPEHLEILKQGVDAWNAWREEEPEEVPDLVGAPLERLNLAGAHLWYTDLARAKLGGTHLERAELHNARLEGADLEGVRLEGADLEGVHLEGANLHDAHLEEVKLWGAHLEGAKLWEAHLEGAILCDAHLEGANLSRAHLEGAILREVHFEGADLNSTYLEGANLSRAHLERADLRNAHLERADLRNADLEGVILSDAHLEGTDFEEANLTKALVSGVAFDNNMRCRNTNVTGCKGSQRFVRHVMDLDYIEETRARHPIRSYLWKVTSDYGRSWGVMVGWCCAVIYIFWAIFADFLGTAHPFVTSIMAFTSFGVVDTHTLTTSELVCISIEAVAGYIMFGALVSLIASQMARRSG